MCGGGVDRDLEGDRDDGPAEGWVGGGVWGRDFDGSVGCACGVSVWRGTAGGEPCSGSGAGSAAG